MEQPSKLTTTPTASGAPTPAIAPTNNSTLANTGSSVDNAAGPSWRHAGKQAVEDDRTDEERAPVIVNLAVARGLARARFVAVGVFLSVLAITSKQLISYMRNIWRIRGHLESLQLADGRFILEFDMEGDYEHVTCGRPWRYQGDAVLVHKLGEKEDPTSVPFRLCPSRPNSNASPTTSCPSNWPGDWGGSLATSSSSTTTLGETSMTKSSAPRSTFPLLAPFSAGLPSRMRSPIRRCA
jgi:hypothetical protein